MEKVINLLKDYFVNLTLKIHDYADRTVIVIKVEETNCEYQIYCHKSLDKKIFSLIVEDIGIFMFEEFETYEEFVEDAIKFLQTDVTIIISSLESTMLDKKCIYTFYSDNYKSSLSSYRRHYNSIWCWQKKKVSEKILQYKGFIKS